jgi:hypothetical protein
MRRLMDRVNSMVIVEKLKRSKFIRKQVESFLVILDSG